MLGPMEQTAVPDKRFQAARDYRKCGKRTVRILLRLIKGQKPSVVALAEGVSRTWVNDLQVRLRSGYWSFPRF